MATIYLVRHGQASFGADDYDVLSPLGVAQAETLGRALAPRLPTVDLVVTGAMRRHRETAAACLGAMGAGVAAGAGASLEDAGWNEFDHDAVLAVHEPRYRDRGAWMASLGPDPGEAMRRTYGDAMARWIGGAHDGYPETWSAFRARAEAALATLVARLGRSRTALVFTSGGPIAAIAGALLGVPEDARLHIAGQLVNAGVTKLVAGARGVRLSTLNDHAHFDGPTVAPGLRTYV